MTKEFTLNIPEGTTLSQLKASLSYVFLSGKAPVTKEYPIRDLIAQIEDEIERSTPKLGNKVFASSGAQGQIVFIDAVTEVALVRRSERLHDGNRQVDGQDAMFTRWVGDLRVIA